MFLTITKRSSTVRNVISSPLDAPKGACLAIGEKAVLGDFSSKSPFRPSQTSTIGDFFPRCKIFEKYFFHWKSFLSIIKPSSTARNVISTPLDAPQGAYLTIGESAILGDFSSKSSFRPSHTSTVGDFFPRSKIFEKCFFHWKSFLSIIKPSSTVRNVIPSPLDGAADVYLAIAILGFWAPYKAHSSEIEHFDGFWWFFEEKQWENTRKRVRNIGNDVKPLKINPEPQ